MIILRPPLYSNNRPLRFIIAFECKYIYGVKDLGLVTIFFLPSHTPLASRATSTPPLASRAVVCSLRERSSLASRANYRAARGFEPRTRATFFLASREKPFNFPELPPNFPPAAGRRHYYRPAGLYPPTVFS